MVVSWLKSLFAAGNGEKQSAKRDVRCRPGVEALESRLVPVTNVTDLTVITPQTMVNTLLGSGSGLNVTNITYTGDNRASGIYSGGAASINLESGIVLSSGRAAGAVGPNNSGGFTGNNGLPGDPDLAAIVAPALTFDASVLEFDFVPTGNVLTFEYVFGSDEYIEFVNSGVFDVFAFFINGNNVAFLPGTNTPINIDTVNHLINTQFFFNNTTGTRFTQMDGFTVVLPIVLPVIPNQSNHIKIAIADVGDSILDSWVMIGNFASIKIDAYRPLRYVYEGSTDTFDGNVTIINRSLKSLPAPLFAIFPDLPGSATLANPDGFTGNAEPFVNLPGDLPPKTPIRLPVQLRNPGRHPLSSFFLDFPIFISNDVN